VADPVPADAKTHPVSFEAHASSRF